MSPPEIYFFGCWQHIGHHLWRPRGMNTDAALRRNVGDIDGVYPPKDPKQVEGRAAVHNLKSGWTIVAWWDRSVDDRPDSNSAFIVRGNHTLSEVLLIAADQFPELLPRFATLVVAV